MASSIPNVHHHPVDGSTLLPILKPLLPHPLALYRRIQIPVKSPSSYLLATFPPDTPATNPPPCFAAAFIDRSRRPDTEVYMFLSGQDDQTKRCPPTGEARCPSCEAALLAIMKHMAKLPLPESIHDDKHTLTRAAQFTADKLNDYKEVTTHDYSRHIVNPNLLLVGSLTQMQLDILIAHGLVRTDLPGPNMPYQKFIIRTAGLASVDTTLPEGLTWGEVRPQDYEMIRARTAIPRKDKTLAVLHSVAVFPTSSPEQEWSPVAWAFVGMDGALMTLHTEPEYRGRGLAKKVTTKLFTEKLRLLDASEGEQEGGWWGHSDAALTNKESQGVATALGGVKVWLCYWVRVDLEKVEGMAET